MSMYKFQLGFIALVLYSTSFSVYAFEERAIGICYAVDHGSVLGPEFAAQDYFGYYENKKIVALPSPGDAELLVQPKHGKVDYVKMQDGLLHARYLADAGYLGDDKFDFKVKVDGKIVRVHYLIKVTDKGADNGEVQDLLCKKTGNHWKISHSDAGPRPEKQALSTSHEGQDLHFTSSTKK